MLHDPATDPHASEFVHPVEIIEPINEDKWAELGDMLSLCIRWITEPKLALVPQLKKGGFKQVATVSTDKIMKRATVFCYLLRPDLFPGHSSVTLAKKLKMTKCAFAQHVSSFREVFPIQTRVMRSEQARENMRASKRKPVESPAQ